MKKNFYEEKLDLIKDLYKQKKIQQAYEIITEELKMPYVPRVYENQFITMKEKLEIDLDNGSSDNVIMGVEKVIDLLFGNEKEQTFAVSELKKHNLRPLSNELKKRIETWKKEDSIKAAILYEIMVLQEISMEMTFDEKKINPINGSIIDNQEFINAIKTLEIYSNKEPQFLESGILLINRYILGIFPNKIHDGKKLAKSIFNINKLLVTGEDNLQEDDYKIKKVLDLV